MTLSRSEFLSGFPAALGVHVYKICPALTKIQHCSVNIASKSFIDQQCVQSIVSWHSLMSLHMGVHIAMVSSNSTQFLGIFQQYTKHSIRNTNAKQMQTQWVITIWFMCNAFPRVYRICVYFSTELLVLVHSLTFDITSTHFIKSHFVDDTSTNRGLYDIALIKSTQWVLWKAAISIFFSKANWYLVYDPS